MERRTTLLDGERISYLEAGESDPVLLLHGTFWSRVWQPVLPRLGMGVRAVAMDFPGFGCSAGRLEREEATLPALADLTLRFAEAVGIDDTFGIGGHDIGGGVAQVVAANAPARVSAMALVNSVLYDSWPVSTVARFKDPDVAAAVTPGELVDGRRKSLEKAVARTLQADEVEEYLAPWRDEDRTRSWTAMAGAADPRYTLDAVPALKDAGLPIALIWGEDDEFQPVEYAERLAADVATAALQRIPGARHIPMEDAPDTVADALLRHFAPRSRG